MAETVVTAGTARLSARAGLVGALLHGLAVLDMFDRDRPVVAVADMSLHLGVHRSTASRLAATLAAAGYLEQAGEPGRYRLAAKLAVLGELAASDSELRRAALPYLRDLVQRLGETGHLGVLDGAETVTVEVVDGWQTVRTRGYAEDREELEPHLCCVAAPVFDRSGQVAASISVSGPASRITAAAVPGIAVQVRATARQISTALGAPVAIPSWPDAA